ncbi:TPA: hypothetical protein EYP38_03475 [Candidatus Micrarchaeota archaeon]|nr:hypothetical protein [Candidatus Micrarchaeota archaeon]
MLRVRAREPLMAAALADILYHGRRAYVYTPFLGRSAAALIAKVLGEAGGGSVTLFASRVGPGGALEPLRRLGGVTVCAPAGGAWAGSFAYSEGGYAAYLPVPLSASLYSKGGGFVVVWPRAPSWLASFLSELSC